MTTADIGFVGLALSGILVLTTLGVSLWQRLGLERSVLVAALRALGQLLLVGVALGLVVDADDPLVFTWVWIAVMLAFAAWTTQRRAPEVPAAFGISLAAYSVAAAVTLAVLFGLRVFPPTGRAIVPLAGMTIGNSLAATVLVTRRLIAEATDKRDQIETRLALGLDRDAAFRPHLRAALRDALIPQLETTKAVGVVFLPGAMVGLILAGTDPVDAVRVQVAVMYLVLGSVTTTTSVSSLLLTRRLFSDDHRLVVGRGPRGSRAEQ